MKDSATDSTVPSAHGYKDIGEEGVADEPASGGEYVDIPDGPPGSGRATDDPARQEALEEARRHQRRREERLG